MTTLEGDQAKRLAELNTLFLTLNDRGQDSALTVLRSLSFAQSVMQTTDALCASAVERSEQMISGKAEER